MATLDFFTNKGKIVRRIPIMFWHTANDNPKNRGIAVDIDKLEDLKDLMEKYNYSLFIEMKELKKEIEDFDATIKNRRSR